MPSDAIIFVPGIKGTKLVDTNRVNFDTIWSGVQSNFESIEDLELTHPLKKQRYDEKIDTIIEAGEIEELAYAEFLKDLNPGKPIFIFNYDWRFSAEENGELLAGFMDYLIEKSNASKNSKTFKKFDFITHSLGNAIVRAYLNNHAFDKVNKVVFTVPPFKGSLDIVSGVVVGEGWFNAKAKFRKLIRTMPGALELLPHYDKVSKFVPGTAKHNFFNFDHWQENVTSGSDKASKDLALKFEEVLKEAKKTVNNNLLDLSDLDLAERRKILVISRTGYDTWQSIKVHKNPQDEIKNYFDFEKGCKTEDGDGRVPDVSSCHYHKSVLTLSIKDAMFFRDYSHGFVLKDERIQKMVRRFLSAGSNKFEMNIPGGSVRKVKGLIEKQNAKGLPYWEVVT